VTEPGKARDPLPAALYALTFVTGVVDAVSFLGLGHVFTANMTGNVVFMAFAVAGAPGLSLARSGLALAAFLAGAAIGGRIAQSRSVPPAARGPALPFALEAALLAVAACASLGVDGGEPAIFAGLVIVLTGVAMGIRNATVRKLAVPDMTTTVLTLTLTGIAADSSPAGGTNPRWKTRVASVVLMFAGAALGALTIRWSPAAALFGSAVISMGAAWATVRRPEASPA